MNRDLSDQKIHGSKYPNGNWKSQNFCDNSTRAGYQVTWYESGSMKSAGDFNKGKPITIVNKRNIMEEFYISIYMPLTIALLILLPLFGAGMYWLYRRVKR